MPPPAPPKKPPSKIFAGMQQPASGSPPPAAVPPSTPAPVPAIVAGRRAPPKPVGNGMMPAAPSFWSKLKPGSWKLAPPKVPFRFKMTLVSLLGLMILGGGAIVLFTRAWVDLSRAYGLLSINRRLESFDNVAKKLEAGEWGLEIKLGADGKAAPVWIKSPEGVDADKLEATARMVSDSVLATRLASGSFEISLDPKDKNHAYFVAFRESNGTRMAVATSAHRSLWDLSPWASPFLGFFFIAVAVTTGLIIFMTSRLGIAYSLLGRAMNDVGAGRFENLELPEDSDSSIQNLSHSLREMAKLLADKEQKIAEVSQLADEDAMTGMKNYRAFTNYMKMLLGRGKARGPIFPVMGIVDLDFFKKVNDNYGHQVGDFVLRHVSKIIKDSIRMDTNSGRTPDFCGRYGGEEFVVIFSECTEQSMHLAAMRLMRDIKANKLRIPAEINEKGAPSDLAISASVGIAAWDPTKFGSKEEWIKEADTALYEAKRRGRARLVRIMPELQEWT